MYILKLFLKTNFTTKKGDFDFPIVNFPFICSDSPVILAYEVYISQLIRYLQSLWFRKVSLTNDHGYVPFVVIVSGCFLHSRFITEFVTRVTWPVNSMCGARTAYPFGAPKFNPTLQTDSCCSILSFLHSAL